MERMCEFNTQNFMEETNFDHFIDLIGADIEDPIANFCLNYDCENIVGCLDHTQLWTNPDDNFLDGTGLPFLSDNMKEMDEGNYIGEESSGTTTTTTATKRKSDRSKTLITERRRRGRMKEKLYALRALVPNITRMDKASIVGDAVLYVQELQTRAKNLKDEIAELESSLTGQGKRQRNTTSNQIISHLANENQLKCKKITQMAMFQVEEKEFYVRMESNKVTSVAVSLYKALESLSRINVQKSSLSSLEDKFILTFTFKVGENEANINLASMKLWITEAFLKQGFEFQAQQSG